MAARRSRPSHRLPPWVRPSRVALHVEVDPARSDRFSGEVAIELELERASRRLRLHAAELRVTRPRLEQNGQRRRGSIELDADSETLEVRFDRPVQRGTATLRLAFSGRLRSDLCGLYAARVGERRYAFTQLEATDARKFFPCFDEPALKARFRLSVTTGGRQAAISNAPVARIERHADGRKTVHFGETPPLSTYLIALAVGELESSRPTHLGPTEIRVWHTPGKEGLTGFARETARACLGRLERYFGVPYPYAKLDLVAVPDFEFGAMENAGAVFFRETLLLIDRATVTLSERKRAAEVIAHELAHMWYGDLVTMAWWDDLWLNEAFATWMAFSVVDDWKPEWKMWNDFQHGRAAALEQDALRHTHPIYCRVRTPSEANENFDLITYEKGASVVRMLERFLGAAVFRRGVRRYIRRHREGNATAADLWRALSEASGTEVEPVARAWIEQAGYPLVSLKRVHQRGRELLELRQERFLEQRQPRVGGPTPRWPIPWVGRVGTSSGRSRLERRLLVQSRERIDLGRRPPRFVYGNAEEGGFFRPLHPPEALAELTRALPTLSVVERMGLVDHQWALVRAGRAPLDGLLELTEALADETDPDVLTALRRPLAFLVHGLVPEAAPASEAAFRSWLDGCFSASLAGLGWQPARGESDDRRLRRASLVGIVGGLAGSPEVIAAAAERCDRYLDDRRCLDPNLADIVVALGARAGTALLHERFVKAMATATTPQEQRRFLIALGDFRAPKLVDRTLALVLTDAVATQDVIFLLARLFSNPAARERTWEFVKRRWLRLRRRMPSLLASRLIEATPSLLTPAHRRDVADFFRRNPVASGERALRQALERFDWYRGFRRDAARRLTAWLAERQP